MMEEISKGRNSKNHVNLNDLERLLEEGVKLAKQLGIQNMKSKGQEILLNDYHHRTKAGYLFKPAKEEVEAFLNEKDTFKNFCKRWYQTKMATAREENDKLREEENDSILKGSQIRSRIRDFKKGAFISDRSLSGLNQSLTRLHVEQAQLQEALSTQRQSKESISHDIDCLEELCQELLEKNFEFVKETERLDFIDKTLKQNEEMNKLSMENKVRSLTRKIQRIVDTAE